MKFEQALEAMRKGKKVRRKAWGKAYIKICNYIDFPEKGFLITMFNNPISLNSAILEDDWEIVDD